MAANIIYSGYTLIRESVSGLMDAADPSLAAQVDHSRQRPRPATSASTPSASAMLAASTTSMSTSFTTIAILLKEAHRLATAVEKAVCEKCTVPLEITTHLECLRRPRPHPPRRSPPRPHRPLRSASTADRMTALREADLNTACQQQQLPWQVQVLPQTPSTSDWLRQSAQTGAPSPNVTFTEIQTSGRGRRENRWQSQPRAGSPLLPPPAAQRPHRPLATHHHPRRARPLSGH